MCSSKDQGGQSSLTIEDGPQSGVESLSRQLDFYLVQAHSPKTPEPLTMRRSAASYSIRPGLPRRRNLVSSPSVRALSRGSGVRAKPTAKAVGKRVV